MGESYIALRKAIKHLYDTFEKYPKPEGTNREFPLKDSDLEVYNDADLIDMPLRLIDADILLTHGTVEQYKYYLPRIFECYWQPKGWSIFLTLSKLTHANWFMWDENEREAVNRYLFAMWDYILTDYRPKSYVSKGENQLIALTCLESLADVCENISPFLEHWKNTDAEYANKYLMFVLAHWWDSKFNFTTLGYLDRYYPGASEQNRQRIIKWFGSKHIRKRLQSLQSQLESDPHYSEIWQSAAYFHDYLRDDY